MTNKSWEVHIIQAKSGKLYTGITNDLSKRFGDHSKGKGARFFHFSAPEQVIYRETHPKRSEASKRELCIKKMTRQEKLNLVN